MYGADVEARLRFCSTPISPRPEKDGSPSRGILEDIYRDNGQFPTLEKSVGSGAHRRNRHIGVRLSGIWT